MTDLPDLIDIVSAAAILQPHLGRLNAANWLADLRRKRQHFSPRVFTSPMCWKHDGRIMYPPAEIERLVREIEIVRNLPEAWKWCR